MKIRSVSMILAVATFIATGAACASAPQDDTEEGGTGALSESDCTASATTEQKKFQAQCEKDNTFDYAACTKPAYDAWSAYQAQVDAAYAAVKDRIDPITGDCKAMVDAKACKDLLSESGQDFAAAAGDQKVCDAARAKRHAKCDSDAKDAIDAELGEGSDYGQLVGQEADQWASFYAKTAPCWAERATKAVAGSTCGARAKVTYQSAYLKCRRQCPTVTASACTPDDYKGQDVPCGQWTTVSSKLGLFCESGQQCERTDWCKKYDTAKSDADRLNKSTGCTMADGTVGVLTPKINVSVSSDADAGISAPTSVTTVCTKLPN